VSLSADVPEDNPNLTLALTLAAKGAFVFPCLGKVPPPGFSWPKFSSRDEWAIRNMWGRWPEAVPAIDLKKSGWFVPDCDLDGEPPDVRDGWAWLLGRCPPEHREALERAPGSITPSGGRHPFFRNVEPPLGNGRGGLPGKAVCPIDPRGAGGYVLAPGADTSPWGGGIYQQIGDLTDIGPMPDWMRETMAPRNPWERAQKSNGRADKEEPAAPLPPLEGDEQIRNVAWGKAALEGIAADLTAARAEAHELHNIANLCGFKAGQLVGGGSISLEEAYARLEAAALAGAYRPGDRVFGLRGTILDGIRAGILKPRRPAPETDAPGVKTNLNGAQGENEREEKAENGEQPFPPILFRPYVFTDPTSIPRRGWVYGRLLIRKFVSVTIAPGGLGKSSLVMVEALAQASCKALLGVEPGGITPGQRMRVAYWNLEDPYEELQRKLQAAMLHHKLTANDIGDRLFVNSGRDTKLVIAEADRNGSRILRPVVNALIAEIIKQKIDILAVDPFVSSHKVPENDNTMQDEIAKEWGIITEHTNCAVHLVHHTRKMGPDSEVGTESARGAKAVTDAARVVRVVNRMTEQEGRVAGVKQHRLYFRTYVDKGNLAPPAEDSDWFKLESVDLGNGPATTLLGVESREEGDNIGVVDTWKWPDPLAGMTDNDFEKVAAVIRRGTWRANSQATDWVGKAVAEALGLNVLKPDEKTKIVSMLKRWVETESLIVVERPDEHRQSRKYVEVNPRMEPEEE
jgi:hypothetical protein